MGGFLFLLRRGGVGGEGCEMSHGDWLTAEAIFVEETRAAFTTSLGGDLYFIKDLSIHLWSFIIHLGWDTCYIQNDGQKATALQLFNFSWKVIYVTKLEITSLSYFFPYK